MNKILVIDDDIKIRDEVIKFLKGKYGDDVVQGEPLTQGQMPRLPKSLLANNENEWRGGSKKKGGKTKWPRR